MIDLSVLICSTHTRYQTFGRAIQDQIWAQYAALSPENQERVEVLFLADNKKQMLGEKRNIMVDMAQGRYVVFVDDDDRLEPDYLSSLLDATASDADVITFLVAVSLNGGAPKNCRYSKNFRHDRNTPREYERLPNHICCVKRDIATTVSFPHIPHGEDSAYSKLLVSKLTTEHHIPRVLYHYDYNVNTTEAQEYLRGKVRQRRQRPVADVIVLSNAVTPQLQEMTQTTIDTCVAGANSMPVNVIVMEQARVKYRNATTIRAPQEFHFHRFANIAASRGKAEWIMLANNDLLFHDGWLHHLLAAQHPVVSPKCPRDPRQREFDTNTTGYKTARHLSGWCFMLKRELWQKIGGFDETVSFWCSDDLLIEQLRELDIPPMIVPEAKVEHIQSVTLNRQPREKRDEMMWGELDKFIDKHGKHRLAGHPDYIKWKRRA